MRVDGRDFRTIWVNADGVGVDVIDQTKLPHTFEVLTLRTAAEAANAIKRMVVRGAPLIGATAAYGMALATVEDASSISSSKAGRPRSTSAGRWSACRRS
jgi:methylthioribose-1-phosphate isomerase